MLGIVLVLGAVIFGGSIVFAIAGDSGLDATIGSQLVLEAAFFGTALCFASRDRSVGPRIEALGLRRPVPAGRGPTALAFFGYIAFAIVFTPARRQPEQDDVADDLGFDQSTLGAIVAGDPDRRSSLRSPRRSSSAASSSAACRSRLPFLARGADLGG